jgi:hypothetical protein
MVRDCPNMVRVISTLRYASLHSSTEILRRNGCVGVYAAGSDKFYARNLAPATTRAAKKKTRNSTIFKCIIYCVLAAAIGFYTVVRVPLRSLHTEHKRPVLFEFKRAVYRPSESLALFKKTSKTTLQ